MTYNDWLSHTSFIPLFFILNIKIKTKHFWVWVFGSEFIGSDFLL